MNNANSYPSTIIITIIKDNTTLPNYDYITLNGDIILPRNLILISKYRDTATWRELNFNQPRICVQINRHAAWYPVLISRY
jgi:hypothetical protein